MKRSWIRAGLLLAAVIVAAPVAKGLKFQPLQLKSGLVLVVRDCGSMTSGFQEFRQADSGGCKEWETEFDDGEEDDYGRVEYPGDDAVLRAMLTQQEIAGHPYQEVWLFSGGGQVEAAVKMARTLRRHRMTVRVHKGFECVSACTVAFMGGYFRYVDEGATYEVHSASKVLQAMGKKDAKIRSSSVNRVILNPDEGLKAFARDEQVEERYYARRAMVLFQNTLILPLNVAQRQEDDDAFHAMASENLPHLAYLDDNNPERIADVLRVKTEGEGAVQDILMRIERENMNAALDELEQELPTLGPRAKPALHMVRNMYMTSIKETSILSRTTLLEQGYVTDEVNLP